MTLLQSPKKIDYKFNEGELIAEFQRYIDSTYTGHYSHKDGIQTTEFIKGMGMLDEFCLTNIIKYTSRYGKKDGKNRKDIMKVLHYAIILLSNNKST